MNWKRGLRYLYLRFVRLRATPDEVALGLAVGVFWGMFPLPGIQMAIAILTAALLGGNKLAAAAATWLGNPLTTVPLTALNFHVGQWVLGREWSELPAGSFQSIEGILNIGGDLLVSYLVGCCVVGAIAGFLTYLLGIPILSIIQRRVATRAKKSQRQRRQ